MERNGVDQMYFVSACRQRKGVHAGAATDIEYARRRRRQIALQDLPRPNSLQTAERIVQPELLLSPVVIVEDLGRNQGGC
jgi:hypothetical protein